MMNYFFGRRRRTTFVEGLVADNVRNNQLNLDETGLTDDGAIELALLLEREVETLEQLSLMQNKIGDRGAARLAQALKKMKKLHTVHLDGNLIGKDGIHAVQALADAFCSMKQLRNVGLSFNRINKDGIKALAPVLWVSKTLERIELGKNLDAPLGAHILASEALRKCESLREILYTDHEFENLPEYSKVSLEVSLRKSLNSNCKVKTHFIDLRRGEIRIIYKTNADLENEKLLADIQVKKVETTIWNNEMERGDVRYRLDNLIKQLHTRLSVEEEPEEEDQDNYVYYTDRPIKKAQNGMENSIAAGYGSQYSHVVSKYCPRESEESRRHSILSTDSTATNTTAASEGLRDSGDSAQCREEEIDEELYDENDNSPLPGDNFDAVFEAEQQALRRAIDGTESIKIDNEEYAVLGDCGPYSCVFRISKINGTAASTCAIKLFPRDYKGLANYECTCLRVLKNDYVVKLVRRTVQRVEINQNVWCWGILLQEGNQNLLTLTEQVQQRPGTNPDLRDEAFRKFFSDAMRPVLLALQHIVSKNYIYANLKLEHVVAIDQGILSYFAMVDMGMCTKYEEQLVKPPHPEYCPPEMARYLCNPEAHDPPKAVPSFDVWTVGVFMLKLVAGERCLLEFQGRTPRQIIRKIACANFSFEDSIEAYVKYEAMKRLIKMCLRRQTADRPSVADLLSDPLIGHALPTALIDRLDLERVIVEKHYETQTVVMQQKVAQLPSLFLILPVVKANEGKVARKMRELLKDECELKFVCEAFNRNHIACSSPDPSSALILKKPGEVFARLAPVIMGTCTLLKIVGLIALVPGAPLGGLLFLRTISDLDLYVEAVLANRLDVRTKEQMKELIQRAQEFQSASGGESVREAMAKLRTACMTPEARQTLLQALKSANDNLDWESQYIIGGLRKVQLRQNRREEAGGLFEHWVCAQHARDPTWYIQP